MTLLLVAGLLSGSRVTVTVLLFSAVPLITGRVFFVIPSLFNDPVSERLSRRIVRVVGTEVSTTNALVSNGKVRPPLVLLTVSPTVVPLANAGIRLAELVGMVVARLILQTPVVAWAVVVYV